VIFNMITEVITGKSTPDAAMNTGGTKANRSSKGGAITRTDA